MIKICNAKVVPKVEEKANFYNPIQRPHPHPRPFPMPRPYPHPIELEENKGGVKCSYNSRREWVCEASYEW